MKKNTLSYCGELVRRNEPDLFLLSMFVPFQYREALWALFAFHYEISKTRDVVSESTLGLIRLQWWRDSIKGIYECGDVPAHEVLKPLAVAIETYHLPRDRFDKLIYAREFDLENVSPGNLEGLYNYCDFTTTPLFELAVQIMEENPDDFIIQPIAIRYCLVKVLFSSPRYALNGRMMLPEDLCDQYGVHVDVFFEEGNRNALRGLMRDIVVQNEVGDIDVNQMFLKGAQVLSNIYFKDIKSNDYNILSEKLKVDPPFKVLRLFWGTKIL